MWGHIGLIVLMPFMFIFAVLLLLGIKLSQAARRRWAESTYSRVTMGMADSNEQQALLIYAASHGLTHMVRDLVRRNIDVNCQDDGGKTALDVAANYEIARLLLDAGAQINYQKIPGMLDNALDSNEVAFLSLLYEITPNVPYREQLLLQALSQKRSDGIIRFLVEHNAPVNAVDTEDWGTEIRYTGGTPLIYAIAYDYYPEIIRLMIKYGADVNYKDLQGKTALMFVIREGENVNVLVDAGANVNAQDKQGKTALMWLVTAVDLDYYQDYFHSDNREILWGSIESIEQLLERGADPAIKDNDNHTALDYAALYHREEVIKLLMEWQIRY